MTKTKSFLLLCLLLTASVGLALAAESDRFVKYLPFVTERMNYPSYWYDKEDDADRLIADAEGIKRLNEAAFSIEDTRLCDLRKKSGVFNGPAFNENLRQRLQQNAESLQGQTYSRDGRKTDAAFFEAMIDNAIDPADSREKRHVRYAIVTERTCLKAFPSEEPILESPKDVDFDYQYYDSLRVNEPLLVFTYSRDKVWCYVRGVYYRGWVRCSDIALCRSRDEWLKAWDIPEERTLVVFGDKVYLENSNYAPDVAGKLLTIGTKLELISPDANELINNRSPYNNYAVYLPVRLENGNYAKKAVLISEHAKVHVGYLPLTKANIARVAFGVLGDAYGWGGMLQADDCSGLVRNTYRCFGLDLAHNSTCQTKLPVESYDLSGLSDVEKYRIIEKLPLGSVLFFKGHEMLYLGKDQGRLYVINALSSILDENGRSKKKIRSVVVNTLDVRRANGRTWLSELTFANIPYYPK